MQATRHAGAFDKNPVSRGIFFLTSNAKLFASFFPSTGEKIPSGLGSHLAAETMSFLADNICWRLKIFLHFPFLPFSFKFYEFVNSNTQYYSGQVFY